VDGGHDPGAVEPNRQQVIGLLAQFHLFDAEVRAASLQTLARMDRESVLAMLTACLADPNDEIRADAAEALLRLDAQRTLPLVMPLLHDPLPEMRWHICGLLSAWADARAVLPLTTILHTDPSSDVRFNAAIALRDIGDARAIPALTDALQDPGTDYEGRRIAAMAENAIAAIIARQGSSPSQEEES
jgi:HEAT repeat protein